MCKNYSDLIIGLVGGLSAGSGLFIIELIRTKYFFKRDEKRILKFFSDYSNEAEEFRSTIRISSEVNLTESRVRDICSTSKKIKRNQLQRETWSKREVNTQR